MLLALANPAEQDQRLAMDELGIAAYDAQGKFVGITNLAEQLKTKLGGLTQAQRDAALAQIFGTDAIRAANVLYQQGGKGIQDWIGKVNDAGYAADTAHELTNNLAGIWSG
jgi:TP901 family phage tail tape measure protein